MQKKGTTQKPEKSRYRFLTQARNKLDLFTYFGQECTKISNSDFGHNRLLIKSGQLVYNTTIRMSDPNKKLIFHRILVPITGTDADDETMHMACWIAKRDKCKIYAMYVITIKRSLPLEAEIESETRRAEELLDRMTKIADEADLQLETDLLQARDVAPTIIDEAIERKIDLIIMGVKYKWRFGQFSLGSIVPYILKNAACQVMLYSQHSNQE